MTAARADHSVLVAALIHEDRSQEYVMQQIEEGQDGSDSH